MLGVVTLFFWSLKHRVLASGSIVHLYIFYDPDLFAQIFYKVVCYEYAVENQVQTCSFLTISLVQIRVTRDATVLGSSLDCPTKNRAATLQSDRSLLERPERSLLRFRISSLPSTRLQWNA